MRKIFQKMMVLLDARQKRQMVGIVILMLIGGVLESVGISLIAPVMEIVLQPEAVDQKPYLLFLYTFFHLRSTEQLAGLIMVALVLVFVIKNIFLYFMNVVQLRFVYTNQFATSRRMMINFMKRPYEYYLNADTSVIQRNITSDVNNMYGLILSVLQLTSEVIVFVCLVVILLSQDAQMTIFIAGLLIVVLMIIKYVIKPVMQRAGRENQDYYSGLYKWIEESVTGIKEIKIAGRENYFINGYADCGAGYVNAVQKYNLYNSTPRLLIETVAIAGMIGYMLFLMQTGVSIRQVAPSLSVLALAAARLLPSANRINTYMTEIAYEQPSLDFVYENLTDAMKTNKKMAAERAKVAGGALHLEKEIRLEGITFRYPDGDRNIFTDASMVIPKGKSVGIKGASGAGKSTIVDILLGLLHVQKGEITCDGANIFSNYESWLSQIGYIPQSIYLIDESIRDNIAFGIDEREIDDARIREVAAEAQLLEFIDSLPEGLDTKIGDRGVRLSGGQRQRIGIARALYHNPEILVFDEATSALDNETEAALMGAINSFHGRKTMIIIAHRLNTIENCDLIYEVKGEKITRSSLNGETVYHDRI